jgi:hypothetical protein
MGDQRSVGTDAEVNRLTSAPSELPERQLDADSEKTGSGSNRSRSALLAALAWAVGGIALFYLFLRIAVTKTPSSDPSNSALQAYDMLHGHLLLHGWLLGDVTFWTFELPVMAIVELFFGLHAIVVGVAEAVVYVIVAAVAIAIAVTDSRGASRAGRAAVVVAVLAAPTLIGTDMWVPLGLPDHTGSTVFLLVSCLLIDRARGWRVAAPLLCVILCAGQVGDVTVRYVAVPAVALVCAYRVLAERKLLSRDSANLLAAVVSVPLSLGARAAMLHYGAYLMVAPKTKIAPVSRWQNNLPITWDAIRELFGARSAVGAAPAGPVVIFGYACLLATAIGILRVLWRWRTARRAEQLLVVTIAGNLAVYVLSTLPTPNTQHDIVLVLPCGAVLAARALVPHRIAGRLTALAVTAFALTAALLPLSMTATQQTGGVVSPLAPVTAWLSAQGLTDGLGNYWQSSAVTLLSGNQVHISAIHVENTVTFVNGEYGVYGVNNPGITIYPWETNTLWYDPTRYYANFVLIDGRPGQSIAPAAERFFGKPASTHIIGTWVILIYQTNLLTHVTTGRLPPTT